MVEDVKEWLIPPLGEVAEFDLPGWLIDALMFSDLRVNEFGGLDRREERISSLPGDWVRHIDNTIEFSSHRPETVVD